MHPQSFHRSRPIHSLMLALACFLMTALRSFCAETPVAPTPSTVPVLATNYVLVTNMVVMTVTNYVITTNTVPGPAGTTAGPTVPILHRLSAPTPALPDLSWVPPPDSFDWIQLKTGEWLKGRIKAVQERQIEFFSEKLTDLTFDWKDIRQLRSPRTLDVLFLDGTKVSGSVIVTPEQVMVGEEDRKSVV
jgi:hypothetical protein